MKRLLLLCSVILAMVGFTGCVNENVAKLKREVEATDKQCPMNMGMMGDMLSLKYDDKAKEVRMYFSLHENVASIDALKNSEEMALKSMKLALSRD